MNKQFLLKRKLKIFLMVIIACLAFSAAVMGLWNAILPQVLTGVKTISFLQALGILVLSKILFGGFRGWGGERRGRWMQMQQKMAAMSPEEREKFKSEWKNRCAGRWRTDAPKPTSTTE